MKTQEFTSIFKAKVAIIALREHNTLEKTANKFGIGAALVRMWRDKFIKEAQTIFEHQKTVQDREQLLKVIGRQQLEIDYLNRIIDTNFRANQSA